MPPHSLSLPSSPKLSRICTSQRFCRYSPLLPRPCPRLVGSNGVRNSRCRVKLWNAFLLVTPLLSRSPSTSLPPFHSSALLPSKRTTAPLGGALPNVGLLRSVRSTPNLPSLDLP